LQSRSRNIANLPPFDKESGAVNIIVESPKNGRIKFKYNEKYNLFEFDKSLPYGFVFPFEFGFIPSTLAEDGDPLDILLLAEEPTFTGCLILGKAIGVLQGQQTDGKKSNRNDRIVAIPVSANSQEPMMPTRTPDKKRIDEITKFFVSYNEIQGKKFKPLGFGSPQKAMELIEEARKRKTKKRT
jgi:inorganic pyrophosphatase